MYHTVLVADVVGYDVDLTEVVVVLNSDAAVQAFSQGGNVTIGGQFTVSVLCDLRVPLTRGHSTGGLSISAGPIGTGAQVNAALQHPVPMFSYTRSRGM
jgi:lipid-binding SYLF domain-containing protein